MYGPLSQVLSKASELLSEGGSSLLFIDFSGEKTRAEVAQRHLAHGRHGNAALGLDCGLSPDFSEECRVLVLI